LLIQLFKFGLAKRKDFSCQGSGGRCVVYYDGTIKDKDNPKTNREAPEDEKAPVGVEGFISDITTDDDTCTL